MNKCDHDWEEIEEVRLQKERPGISETRFSADNIRQMRCTKCRKLEFYEKE